MLKGWAVRIVITGATGNVGTSLIERLAGDDGITSIVGIARRRPAVHLPRTEWVTADVARDDLTPYLAGADAVVHLAWLLQPERDVRLLDRVNVAGSERVFEACARAQVPALVYASSVGAYAPRQKTSMIDESWPTTGIATSLYSTQKAKVERILDDVERRHQTMRIARIRPSLIFKRESASEQQRLFLGQSFPVAILRPGRLPLVPFHSTLRFQAVHSLDVADAYHRAIVRDVVGAFNIAADPVIDARVLAQVLRTRTVPVPPFLMRLAVSAAYSLRLMPASPGWLDMAQNAPLMDALRARTVLGWNFRYSADAVLSEIFAAFADHAGRTNMPPLEPQTRSV